MTISPYKVESNVIWNGDCTTEKQTGGIVGSTVVEVKMLPFPVEDLSTVHSLNFRNKLVNAFLLKTKHTYRA